MSTTASLRSWKRVIRSLAWMGYFEARKGAFSLFTDVVWLDLGFPGHAKDDFNRQASGHPFDQFPGVDVSVDANLHIKANAQLDYQSTIVQSGVGFEVANWAGPSSRTALDLLGGARYWNQNVDTSISLKGNLTAEVSASATFDPRDVLKQVLRDRGFRLKPRTSQAAATLDRPASRARPRHYRVANRANRVGKSGGL